MAGWVGERLHVISYKCNSTRNLQKSFNERMDSCEEFVFFVCATLSCKLKTILVCVCLPVHGCVCLCVCVVTSHPLSPCSSLPFSRQTQVSPNISNSHFQPPPLTTARPQSPPSPHHALPLLHLVANPAASPYFAFSCHCGPDKTFAMCTVSHMQMKVHRHIACLIRRDENKQLCLIELTRKFCIDTGFSFSSALSSHPYTHPPVKRKTV